MRDIFYMLFFTGFMVSVIGMVTHGILQEMERNDQILYPSRAKYTSRITGWFWVGLVGMAVMFVSIVMEMCLSL